MTTEESLQQLRQALRPYLPLLDDAAASVRDQDISNYPVFAVFSHADEVSIGLPLVDGTDTPHGWSVNVTTLEELAAKNVVAMENVERFTAVYKSHTDALCCLAFQDGTAQFVFIPYLSAHTAIE